LSGQLATTSAGQLPNLSVEPGTLITSGGITGGLFYQFVMGRSIRLQGGIEYFHTAGTSPAYPTAPKLGNPNAEGLATYTFDLTQLLAPFEIMATPRLNEQFNLLFSFGYVGIIPINESGSTNFTVNQYNSFYPKVYANQTAFTTIADHAGITAGAGLIQKFGGNHEITYRLRYYANHATFGNSIVNTGIVEFTVAIGKIFGK
jgi:hypothetical protein